MEIQRRYLISATRERVWEALNDTEVLRQTIPGCNRIEWMSETTLAADVSVNLGVAKPTFKGELALSDVEPAQSYTLSGRGKGGIFGHGEGRAHITLRDCEDGTVMTVDAGGSAGGQVAKLGMAVLGQGVIKIMDKFFARFGAAMDAKVTPIGAA